ncbi:hypothetical protein RRG08_016061 [Elysia crispata]|uniref:Uncharacterized protein n=1 Tax=Elysia crispata TaxID=231223 RepID=A0AAE1DKE1_9GAST|nr:hypothetical protein RRG08_016061 [Elysia crispata]
MFSRSVSLAGPADASRVGPNRLLLPLALWVYSCWKEVYQEVGKGRKKQERCYNRNERDGRRQHSTEPDPTRRRTRCWFTPLTQPKPGQPCLLTFGCVDMSVCDTGIDPFVTRISPFNSAHLGG